MKQSGIIAVIAILYALTCTSTSAQISLDATVNLPSPVGDWGDAYDTGYGAGADVFFSLPLVNMKFGGRVAYNRFSTSDDFKDGHLSMVELIPSVRYTLTPPLSPVKLYGQFGIGMYRWNSELDAGTGTVKDDGADYGISVGVGAAFKPLPILGVFAMPMYHLVKTDGDNLDYFTFNLGVLF